MVTKNTNQNLSGNADDDVLHGNGAVGGDLLYKFTAGDITLQVYPESSLNRYRAAADQLLAIFNQVESREGLPAVIDASIRAGKRIVATTNGYVDTYVSVEEARFLFGQLISPRLLRETSSELEKELHEIDANGGIRPYLQANLNAVSPKLSALAAAMHDAVFSAARVLDRYPMQKEIGPDVQGLIEQVRLSRRLEELERAAAGHLAEIEQATAQADQALKKVKDATGISGQLGMAGSFGQRGRTEARRGLLWDLGFFLFTLAGVGISLMFLTVAANTDFFAVNLAKALTGVPLLGAAVYCGRVAAQHRETARHFILLSEQMTSVRAYVDELPDDKGKEMLVMLGRRAFSNPEPNIGEDIGAAGRPADAIPLLERALTTLTGSGGTTPTRT